MFAAWWPTTTAALLSPEARVQCVRADAVHGQRLRAKDRLGHGDVGSGAAAAACGIDLSLHCDAVSNVRACVSPCIPQAMPRYSQQRFKAGY